MFLRTLNAAAIVALLGLSPLTAQAQQVTLEPKTLAEAKPLLTDALATAKKAQDELADMTATELAEARRLLKDAREQKEAADRERAGFEALRDCEKNNEQACLINIAVDHKGTRAATVALAAAVAWKPASTAPATKPQSAAPTTGEQGNQTGNLLGTPPLGVQAPSSSGFNPLGPSEGSKNPSSNYTADADKCCCGMTVNNHFYGNNPPKSSYRRKHSAPAPKASKQPAGGQNPCPCQQ